LLLACSCLIIIFMKLTSIDPATGKVSFEINCWSDEKLLEVAESVIAGQASWSQRPLHERIKPVLVTAQRLKKNREQYATLISREMGKVISESYGEIDKSIHCCEYYAENSAKFLADEIITSDASLSFVTYQPLGSLLGIMPWNFPFWQVFRFAVPALLTGNTVLLKHASNVPQSARAAEKLLHECGIPEDAFRSLMVSSAQIDPLVTHPGINGIALTGSEATGRKVAKLAGENLKKVVLELGGSDAFVVLEDADIELAVKTAVTSRFFTSGQSCINAKRIILVDSIADKFMPLCIEAVKSIPFGDPLDPSTRVGPMARRDLRDKLHQQVLKSIDMGAKPVVGCAPLEGTDYYYQPSILDHVVKGMPAYEEEIFGPVASIIYAQDEQDAIRIANDTRYGLGGSLWTRDSERGNQIARQLDTGTVYVNGLMKSDPRLPFGGVKNSGIGRELCRHGMLEFTNAKTVWIA